MLKLLELRPNVWRKMLDVVCFNEIVCMRQLSTRVLSCRIIERTNLNLCHAGINQCYGLDSIGLRNYAKGKDKKGDKKKAVVIDETFLASYVDIDDFHSQLKQHIDQMKADYVANLTLRTSVGAIENLKVSYDGKIYSVQDLAQIGKKNPKLYVLDFASFPQVIPDVIRAMQASGLGLNPQQDNVRLYVPVVTITKQHRELLAKNAKALFVKYKESISATQTKIQRSVERRDKISDDDMFLVREMMSAISRKYVAEAEALMQQKQKELLGSE